MMYGWGNPGFRLMSFAWIPMIVWLVLLGVAVFVVIRVTDRHGRHTNSQESGAQRILDERYARGEIDAETYRQMKATLKEK